MKNNFSKLSLNAHQPESELQIFISPEDKRLGQIFILAEVKKGREYTKRILKQIIEESKKNYFKSIAQDTEKALEDSLQKLNFSLSEMIKEVNKEWLNYSNVVIAACREEEIHFAKIGQIETFLISGKEIINITKGGRAEEVNPVKPFANIYSGELPADAAILFITENILDYVSQEKLRQLIIQNDGPSALVELKNIFKKAPANKVFASILMKREEEIESVEKQKEPVIMKKTKDITTKTLKKAQSATPLPLIAEKEKPKIKRPRSLLRKGLPRTIITSSLFLAIIVSAGLFLFNILTGEREKQPTQTPTEEIQYQILLNNIQSKFIQSQDYLIIDDRKSAQQSLQEAINLIDQLPAQTAAEQEQKQSLVKKVTTQLLLAQGVNLVIPTLLQEIADFLPQQLVLKEDVIYTFDPANNGIYQLTLNNNELTKLEITSTRVGNLSKVLDHTGQTLIFYHSLDGLSQLDLETNKLNALEWNRSWSGQPKAVDIYQNKLYLVSTQNDLLKYTPSITGFTQEVTWLNNKAQINLATAVDLSIDGTIWVLKSTGEVIKLFKGEREEFNFEINPPLQGPTRLYTDLDINYLYLLDPPSKRIVILNKSGALINQFTAQEFTSLSDLAVDESSRKIYLLDENRIFEVGF